MSDTPSQLAPAELLSQLRQLLPNRPVTYGQALALADRQATRVRRSLDCQTAVFDLSWLFALPGLTVELKPEYKMLDHTSGVTTKVGDELVIFLNANDYYLRQRFTLVHELKHAMDYDAVDTLYRQLGSGDDSLHDKQIESICNHFAASVLMPKVWVNRLWSRGIQDTLALAYEFQVSAEAMRVRLERLGYIESAPRPNPQFFRRTTVPTRQPQEATPCLVA